ncbi:hypothetical protein EBS67_17975 [bacterium]|nr:hypothetical protein [bacterium]
MVTKLSHPFAAIKFATCVPAALKVKEFIENGKLLEQIVVSTITLKFPSSGCTAKEIDGDAQPLTSVAITVYDPAVVAVYVEPVPTDVDPLLQEYDIPPLDVKSTLPPEQKVVAPPAVIVAIGKALTVTTVATLVAVQPFASVTCTVYDPAVVVVMATVVAPLLQRYDIPPLAVKSTLPPEQKVVAPPAVNVAIGKALTVTAAAVLVAVQPFASVTVTAGEDVVETVIVCVVAPVDHK